MTWICIKPDCGHIVIADTRPWPIKWTDGHVCVFKPELEDPKPSQEEKTDE